MIKLKYFFFFTVQTVLLIISADSIVAKEITPKNKEGDAAVKEVMAPSLPSAQETKIIVIEKGDTLGSVLQKEGISDTETHQVLTHLRKKFDPKDLQIGQPVSITFATDDQEMDTGKHKCRLCRLKVPGGFNKDWVVEQNQDATDFTLQEIERPIESVVYHHKVEIYNSIFVDGVRNGIPEAILVSMVKQLSFDIDFQRDIQPESTFEVVYEQNYDPDRHQYKSGKILFAAITIGEKTRELYLFKDKSGHEEYYNTKGESIVKALLRTPLDAIRVTSKFGSRRHPILGYTRMHKGVDFGAPKGTPIYAAGHGVVQFVGTKGGYGKYIKIKHSSKYSTAYAHLNRYRKGLKKGQKVKQGQVIGYVGMTGTATGPHLHYEILVNNKHVNPLKVKVASEKKLPKSEMKAFEGTKVKTADLCKELPTTARRLVGPLNTAAQITTDSNSNKK